MYPLFVLNQQNGMSRVAFSEIRPIKKSILSIALVWQNNSYLLNIKDKFFIINGGLKTQIPLQGDAFLYLRKRHRTTFLKKDIEENNFNSVFSSEVFYVLGLESVNGQPLICLVISSDGSSFFWERKKQTAVEEKNVS